MKRMTMVAFAVLGSALMLAAVATAGKPGHVSAHKLVKNQCKTEKKADRKAFKAVYGRHAMRTCKRSEKPEVKDEIHNAAKDCKAERSADPDAFKETYGSNKNGKNAFGKCVSQKARAQGNAEEDSFQNAAQACRAERSEDRDAFRDKYGTEKSRGKNAFGKCVSSSVKADEEDGTA